MKNDSTRNGTVATKGEKKYRCATPLRPEKSFRVLLWKQKSSASSGTGWRERSVAVGDDVDVRR